VAEALARWTAEVVVPEAEAALGTRPAALAIGTSYQCRPRNGQAGAKLSEHGIGNGVDLMGVRFATGPAFDTKPFADDDEQPLARFARAIRAGACRHFATVLGPGSDAAHGNHFHLDLARRKNGYRLCQ
jgi:hypothetical protein